MSSSVSSRQPLSSRRPVAAAAASKPKSTPTPTPRVASSVAASAAKKTAAQPNTNALNTTAQTHTTRTPPTNTQTHSVAAVTTPATARPHMIRGSSASASVTPSTSASAVPSASAATRQRHIASLNARYATAHAISTPGHSRSGSTVRGSLSDGVVTRRTNIDDVAATSAPLAAAAQTAVIAAQTVNAAPPPPLSSARSKRAAHLSVSPAQTPPPIRSAQRKPSVTQSSPVSPTAAATTAVSDELAAARAEVSSLSERLSSKHEEIRQMKAAHVQMDAFLQELMHNNAALKQRSHAPQTHRHAAGDGTDFSSAGAQQYSLSTAKNVRAYEDAIQDLEFSLLYGDTVKDKQITALNAHVASLSEHNDRVTAENEQLRDKTLNEIREWIFTAGDIALVT